MVLPPYDVINSVSKALRWIGDIKTSRTLGTSRTWKKVFIREAVFVLLRVGVLKQWIETRTSIINGRMSHRVAINIHIFYLFFVYIIQTLFFHFIDQIINWLIKRFRTNHSGPKSIDQFSQSIISFTLTVTFGQMINNAIDIWCKFSNFFIWGTFGTLKIANWILFFFE